MLEGDADAEEEGEADEEDQDVSGGVEDAFGYFVVLVGGALGWEGVLVSVIGVFVGR